ncbi:SpoIIE family protein phosphatase [Mycobacterium gordonae]|uniref:histidine kinase n=1 Tax=Mycobacterium gordonae TaxID=1778 RepID=A0A1X1W8K0_MYCGO|nr:SpoIIE family protein phosphatase [Mycobacterium gordonae]MCV7004300.1 SpoIIE family protein phosphatase [Mycobacterium gordonae]ODR22011.1 histidine kinase [Mycobacterium gordonae]ORV82822.1 histidine kinase [Mycobacterium gordonae]
MTELDQPQDGPGLTRQIPEDLACAAALGGEMGRRIAEFDWASHPLGPLDRWPAEHRFAVAEALTSRFPTSLWLNPQDMFLLYNDAYRVVAADRHPAALGRRGSEAWWDIWDTIGPMFDTAVTTGETTWREDLLVPMVSGGHRFDRYFTFTVSPLIDARGHFSGSVSILTETTERVMGERRLHLLNSVASAVMEVHSIDGAISAAVDVCSNSSAIPDLPFVAVYVADEKADALTLRGATASALPVLPHSLAELTQWSPASRAESRIVEAVGLAIPGLPAALGDRCPEQAMVLPVGVGSTTGALVVGINPGCRLDHQYRGFFHLLADQLSSAFAAAASYELQCQRAEALAELDEAKTVFLTNISHEFRTPLTLLLGPLDDELADAEPNSLRAHRLDIARRNAARLLRLVDSLLDFSRLQAGRAAANLVTSDVGALTADIASSFSDICSRADLELVIDCQPAPAQLDRGMWETIMLNLLSNAVKYTLAGSISVTARVDAAHCVVVVRDTGVGIAGEDLDRLFERFYRANNVAGRSVEGTGIGLSLVRGLVDLHGGTVHIDSEVGHGTVVTIRLPRALDKPGDHPDVGKPDETNPYVAQVNQWLSPVEHSAVATSPVAPRQLVLIADDNADMRAHLDRVLSEHYDTVLVADGQSALAACRERRPDAVVTDVMMPGMDGFALAAAIRADPMLAATPVLMLSARAGADAAREGFAGGADDYLPKPFGSQDLIDRLRARLTAVRRERDRQRREAQQGLAAELVELDAALQATDSVAGIMAAVLDSSLASADAGAVTIGVVEQEHHIRFEYHGELPAELRNRYHVAALESPWVEVDVIRTGEPMVIPDTFDLPIRYQHRVTDTAASIRACVVHPLPDSSGRTVAVLSLLWPAPRQFGTEELDMFARIAQLTSAALDRVRINAHEHRMAIDFQEHLLEVDHSSTAAVVAARYQPAGEALGVGGDWFSVTPIDRARRLGLSVGDVVGHGLNAAIVMSNLRAVVAASALTADDPGAVLNVLDRYAAASVPSARCTTVAYAIVDIDPGGGGATVAYSCAGHPFPLVIHPDREPEFLRSGRRLPIAAGRHSQDSSTDHTATAVLAPGSALLLYTDGLIERPHEDLDIGFARLHSVAAECAHLPVESLCADLLAKMAPKSGYRDDVVVLAVRPNHLTARSFATAFPAVPVYVPHARQQLGHWLSAIEFSEERHFDILLAATEAVTNAVEHGGHSDQRNTVSIEGLLREQAVTLTVSDTGRWVGDSAASLRGTRRGRGLTLISRLSDHVETNRTPAGTRVTMHFDSAVTGDLAGRGDP